MKKMQRTTKGIWKKCKTCGKKFECYDRVKHAHGRILRPFNSINCSKQCSRDWVYTQIYQRMDNERKKRNKKNKSRTG
jgi:hypothetical protein